MKFNLSLLLFTLIAVAYIGDICQTSFDCSRGEQCNYITHTCRGTPADFFPV
ncbi:hypothetical protein GLOIN_2v1571707 [Rhizophagus irregularis DAOM 181602=DAOM 197198]|uniref:Uncharacterized protein n=1 Tax=Rhizophagus irregularis (strain DAOM 181602 / DAOM 197198 / MUCL 43194) TaxID=747089 RepID=A0A2P4QAY2_RHIID|nr:hypothetical protein GLOIN_2v1571707 [Rhizophagus irregularis DAOM 181602=DAOM 197198]POG74800.1 hypothetical protein GLOIN_2v1571707 [Rhizophagus irregularis DAOM 181602=DAOM 197198]|eukprot:XP_025181666.1 hypothetical protein GLOIN_2v1571707 [Rhizophagus irregularis DAOM 181602=DAOM 197198]